ncbi:IS3 family transposase, partial [Paenibacillus sp. 28ISP30-2]|nr:IS3 family transposase [Paenibacillus sp. 28ISP30-2]
MCAVFGVSRSGYYRWVQTRTIHKERQKQREKLLQRIRRIFLDSRRLYGSRKIHKALVQQG